MYQSLWLASLYSKTHAVWSAGVEDVLKPIFGGSDDKPKKSGKAVVVSVDADTPTEDVAKQISEVVAKTVAEMMGKKKEE